MGETILVASGKGGTGKSVITVNLGALLAKRGFKVLLLDMDMGMRNLDLYLGLENKVIYNVMDVLSGLCRISQALIKDTRFQDLYLMSTCPRKDGRDVTPLHMEVLGRKLKGDFDFIFVDCPAGIGEGLDAAAASADKALIVTEPDIAAIRDADILNRYLYQMGFRKTCYVVNKVRADLMEQQMVPNLKEISEALNSQLVGIIQFDDNIHIFGNQGIPVVFKEGTYIEENFKNILIRLLRSSDR